MSGTEFDVAIVGAGIVGAACAEQCATAGMSVAIIEAQMIGGGATSAGMGHIVVMDDSEAQFQLTRYSQTLWRDLRPVLPKTVEYEACGTIWVAADDEEMQEVERKRGFYQARDVPVEVLNGKALMQSEPNLRQGLAGGLLVPEDGVLYPPCAASFLVQRATERGARLFCGQRATSMGEGAVSLADGQRVSGKYVVNAAGAWSGTLTAGLPIRGRKGHLAITDRYPGFVRHQLVELGYLKSAHSVSSDSVAFNVQPRMTGQVLIGSSRQYDADDSVESTMLSRMLSRAQEYMPGIKGLSIIRTWVGFRPAIADKLPVIGPSLVDPTLYYATGHEGLGITTSLGTGRLLADMLLGRPTAIPVEPYLASRLERMASHG